MTIANSVTPSRPTTNSRRRLSITANGMRPGKARAAITWPMVATRLAATGKCWGQNLRLGYSGVDPPAQAQEAQRSASDR